MDKLCECGCGQSAPFSKKTRSSLGIKKGEQWRFINGHGSRMAAIQGEIQKARKHLSGTGNPRWNGGKYRHSEGYVMVLQPGHPRAMRSGYVLEHILIAEKALGRVLPKMHEVHHVNGIRNDNRRPFNLVICENHEYHMLLHLRADAYAATGNPNTRKCRFCKRWDLTVTVSKRGHGYHKICAAAYEKGQLSCLSA